MSQPDRPDRDPETWRELWQMLSPAARVRAFGLILVILFGAGVVVTSVILGVS